MDTIVSINHLTKSAEMSKRFTEDSMGKVAQAATEALIELEGAKADKETVSSISNRVTVVEQSAATASYSKDREALRIVLGSKA